MVQVSTVEEPHVVVHPGHGGELDFGKDFRIVSPGGHIFKPDLSPVRPFGGAAVGAGFVVFRNDHVRQSDGTVLRHVVRVDQQRALAIEVVADVQRPLILQPGVPHLKVLLS